MSLKEITSDSGICLSAEKQKSKPSSRGYRSNSDGEHTSEEENGHVRRCSQNTSRISVRVSRQKSESDSSDDDHVRDKPAETDSGISLIMFLYISIFALSQFLEADFLFS